MIILFGPAGSGKSTQGRLLADKFGWQWLSVGQVLRDSGRFAETLREGKLVNDDQVIEIMNYEIEKADAEGENVILDGYPRDEYQAKWMLDNGMMKDVEMVVVLNVPKDELWNRIEKRGREDDTREVVERRFSVFHENIEAILGLFDEANVKVVEVDGVGSFEEVTAELTELIADNIEGAEVVDEKLANGTEQSYGE